MNEAAARAVLERLAAAPVVLWRGDSLAGTDIDLLMSGDWERDLAKAGLTRHVDHWVNAGGDVLVDPMPIADWPRAYPPAEDVIRRAERRDSRMPLVASAGDRLAIFVADAVAGHSMAKLEPKLRAALAEAPAAGALANRVLAATPRRDALPWGRAIEVAARSARGRHALRERLRESRARRSPQKKR